MLQLKLTRVHTDVIDISYKINTKRTEPVKKIEYRVCVCGMCNKKKNSAWRMYSVPYSDKSCHIPGWALRTVEVVSPGCIGAGVVALCVWARRLTVSHRNHTINPSSGARPVAKPNTSTGSRTRASGVKCDSRKRKKVCYEEERSLKCNSLSRDFNVHYLFNGV